MSVENYDPRLVTVIIDGIFITGFAEGSFVECEKDEENYSTYVGAQGEVSRARNANPIGTITLTTKSTSPSNGYLSGKARSKDMFPVQVIDGNGNFKAGGNECWIEKPASWEGSDEISEREWVIKVADYDQTEG